MDRPESNAPFSDSERRAKALESYEIMDTPPEQAFDDLTYLTSFICSTPIALVTFLAAVLPRPEKSNSPWAKAIPSWK